MMSKKKKERVIRIFTIVLVVFLALALALGPIFMFFG